MSIEAFEQTFRAIGDVIWGKLTRVDNLDTIRSKGKYGQAIASRLSARDPHNDQLNKFWKQAETVGEARTSYRLAERMIAANISKLGLSSEEMAEVHKCLNILAAELNKNEKLLENYKELCKTLNEINNGNASEAIRSSTHGVSHLVSSFIPVLGTGPAAGYALGIMALSAVASKVLETVYDSKEKTQRKAIEASTAEVCSQVNHSVAVFLGVLSQQPEHRENKEYLTTAQQSLALTQDTHLSRDTLADVSSLAEYEKHKHDLKTQKHMKKNIEIGELKIQKSVEKLWATLDEPAASPPRGRIKKFWDKISGGEGRQKAIIESKERAIVQTREALRGEIDTRAALQENLEQRLGRKKPSDKAVRFNLAPATKSAQASGKTSPSLSLVARQRLSAG